MTNESERQMEAATLAINAAMEVADLAAAGGPSAGIASLGVVMRTGERLAALNRGERVLAPTGAGEAREVFVVVDGVRRTERRVEP